MNFDLPGMKASADDACALLKALANPHRLMIVCSLIDGEQSVGALAQLLGVRETLASQHLGLLRVAFPTPISAEAEPVAAPMKPKWPAGASIPARPIPATASAYSEGA